MNKLNLVILLLIFFSCSKDEMLSEEKVCRVVKNIDSRYVSNGQLDFTVVFDTLDVEYNAEGKLIIWNHSIEEKDSVVYEFDRPKYIYRIKKNDNQDIVEHFYEYQYDTENRVVKKIQEFEYISYRFVDTLIYDLNNKLEKVIKFREVDESSILQEQKMFEENYIYTDDNLTKINGVEYLTPTEDISR